MERAGRIPAAGEKSHYWDYDVEEVSYHRSGPRISFQTGEEFGLDEPLIFLSIQEQNRPLPHDKVIPSVFPRRSLWLGIYQLDMRLSSRSSIVSFRQST